jgi:hypothetical protein
MEFDRDISLVAAGIVEVSSDWEGLLFGAVWIFEN